MLLYLKKYEFAHTIYTMWSKSQIKILPSTYLIMAALIIVLAVLLKNKSARIRTIPLAVIAAVMVIGEIVKITLSIATKQFNAWYVPLHYCSALMLWFFLSCFFTKKTRNIFYTLSISMGMPAVIVFLIYPNSMLRDSTDFLFNRTFYHYHNFIYHILMVLFIILLISLKLYKPKIENLKYVLICFYIWVTTAAIFSNILNESYANLLRGDFEILEKIRLTCGYYIYLLFLYAAGYTVIAGTFLTVWYTENYLERKKEKISEEPKKCYNIFTNYKG